MKKFFANLCLAPFSAALTAPLSILLMFLYAWPFTVGYNDVLIPVLQCYGISMPVVPFVHWCVLMAFVSMIRITLGKINIKDLDPSTEDLRRNAAVRRIAGVIACALIFYIIKWLLL